LPCFTRWWFYSPQPSGLPDGGRRRPEQLQRLLTYYSFITHHYRVRDITPIQSRDAPLAMLEALVGQLYPAITLARLLWALCTKRKA
jgi:hypothetical protein